MKTHITNDPLRAFVIITCVIIMIVGLVYERYKSERVATVIQSQEQVAPATIGETNVSSTATNNLGLVPVTIKGQFKE